MTATAAAIAYGATFGIESATPDTYDTIAEITGITPPDLSRGSVDATHLASPNRVREFVPGLFEYGEAQLTMNVTSAKYDTLLTAAKVTAGGKYKITLPDTSTIIFEGFFTSLGAPTLGEAEGIMTVSATIKPKGAIAFTDNS